MAGPLRAYQGSLVRSQLRRARLQNAPMLLSLAPNHYSCEKSDTQFSAPTTRPFVLLSCLKRCVLASTALAAAIIVVHCRGYHFDLSCSCGESLATLHKASHFLGDGLLPTQLSAKLRLSAALRPATSFLLHDQGKTNSTTTHNL